MDCIEDWRNKLEELMVVGDLPVHWGGTVTDPDGDIFCTSKVRGGGVVVVECEIDQDL